MSADRLLRTSHSPTGALNGRTAAHRVPVTEARARLGGIAIVLVAAAPVLLFALALGIRLWAAGQVDFAPTEGSAYYVGVARNIVDGRGLVTDAMWSYATPPLVLPKPAFELWMPIASLLAAVPMAIFGATLGNAQLSSVLVGAAVAPLAWLVARDAARRHGLDHRRTASVEVTAGLGAALSAPLVTAAMGPDSSTPFTVLVLAACLAVPGALAGRLRPAVALGVCLGLAYLARQEAIYLGATLLLAVFVTARRTPADHRNALVTRALGLPVVVAAVVVVPWFARNLSAFGTLFPGQALENAWITGNEQIFAYAQRPTASGFLAQGPGVILSHIGDAMRTNLVESLLLPAAPLTLVAAAALLFARRWPSLHTPAPLAVLLLSGALTFLATSVLFPVATRWGTFLHASGPFLVGLIVVAALALDTAVERLGRWRDWPRPNVILPALLVAGLTLPLAVFQVRVLAVQTAGVRDDFHAIAASLQAQPELADPRRPILTDHPIWLAELLRRPALALPDESPADVWRLASTFDAGVVVLRDGRGRYPAAFVDGQGQARAGCFVERPVDPGRYRLFVPAPTCPGP